MTEPVRGAGHSRHAFSVFVFLYALQGVAQGLVMSTLPFLVHPLPHVDEVNEAWLSMAAYPFAFKMAWSWVVEKWGTSHQWALVTQALTAVGLVILYGGIREGGGNWLGLSSSSSTTAPFPSIFPLALVAGGIMFLSATGDIAIDAWASKVLRQQAALCQTIGVDGGFYVGYGLFVFHGGRIEHLAWFVGILTLLYGISVMILGLGLGLNLGLEHQPTSGGSMHPDLNPDFLLPSKTLETPKHQPIPLWKRPDMCFLGLFYVLSRFSFAFVQPLFLEFAAHQRQWARWILVFDYPLELVLACVLEKGVPRRGGRTWAVAFRAGTALAWLMWWIQRQAPQTWSPMDHAHAMYVAFFYLGVKLAQNVLFTEVQHLHHHLVRTDAIATELTVLASLDNVGRVGVQTVAWMVLSTASMKTLVYASLLSVGATWILWRRNIRSFWARYV